jgi:hypothetical protein
MKVYYGWIIYNGFVTANEPAGRGRGCLIFYMLISIDEFFSCYLSWGVG